jgi:hypothetical protein
MLITETLTGAPQTGHLLLAAELRVGEDLNFERTLGSGVDAIRHTLHADRAREIRIAQHAELAGDLALSEGRRDRRQQSGGEGARRQCQVTLHRFVSS